MESIVNVLIPVAMGALLLTLATGIYALFRGGDFGRSYSNKLMRLRVVLQFAVVMLLALAAYLASS